VPLFSRLELLRNDPRYLHHRTRKLILTPACNFPRPLEVERDLIPQGPDILCLECAGLSKDHLCVIRGPCETDLEFGDLVEVVLLGGEVDAHG
jgi:hypothetical protein